MGMAGWGLDKELLGGSGVLPAYPARPSLTERFAEAWRILTYVSPSSQLPERHSASVSAKRGVAQPG
jgi:hypothetical protein